MEIKQLNGPALIDEAMRIAVLVHEGQKRKDGKDYISHPQAVADIVSNHFFELMPQNATAQANWSACKDHIIAAALLHDTIENTFITPEYFRSCGFSEMTIEIIYLCTKQPGENYFDFIMRLQESGHIGAKIVMLADLWHNMYDLKEGSMKDTYRFAQYILTYFND